MSDPNTNEDQAKVAEAQAAAEAAMKAQIKANLDKAYNERDAAKAERDRLVAELAAVKAANLAAEGKAVEAAKLEAATAKELAERLAQENTILTRDAKIEQALSGLHFQTPAARKAAMREVSESLVRTENGWASKDGADVATFVAAYAAHPENQYLFVPKRNSGAGSSTGAKPAAETKRSLLALDNNTLLQMARENKLNT